MPTEQAADETLSRERHGERDWFGQPRGLTILFLTEMWEVFSFVGMRTMLIYYMTKQLLIDQQSASLTYGLYSGLVYLTPIVGGVIADRWLGRRNAVVVGAAVMALGHFMLISESLFYAALATVALGNGFFLPSLPSQISSLYAPDDPRRESAFSIYYMGKNLGAFLAPLVCGTLGEFLGWHWGFGAAGIGMLCGLLIYLFGRRYLPDDLHLRDAHRVAGRNVANAEVGEPGMMKRFVILGAVAASVVVFRGAYEQTGNTIALWIDQSVDRTLAGGVLMPLTWFQSINPLLVFVLTPLLVAHWVRLGRAGGEPSALTKMASGAAMVALAYAVLAVVATFSARSGTQPGWIWPMLFFALLTLGELYVLPVGLGLFSRLAPASMAATLIAFWYCSSFGGNLLAGVVGSFWSRLAPGSFFALMACLAALACLALYMLRRSACDLELRLQPRAPLGSIAISR